MYKTRAKDLKQIALAFGSTAFAVSALICSIMVLSDPSWTTFGILLVTSLSAGLSTAFLSRTFWKSMVQKASEPARWRPFVAGASSAVLAYFPTFLVAGFAFGLFDSGSPIDGLAFGFIAALYGLLLTGWGTGFVGGMVGLVMDKRLNPDVRYGQRTDAQEATGHKAIGSSMTMQDHEPHALDSEEDEVADPLDRDFGMLKRSVGGEETAAPEKKESALDPLSDDYDPLLAEFAKLEEQLAQEEQGVSAPAYASHDK